MKKSDKESDKEFYRKHKNHVEYKYLPEFVYGGIDGSVTTFAVVAGVIGASLSSSIILILGFANLFADGFSMATSDYLSIKTENELNSTKKQKHPLKVALATFVSFILVGLIPLLSFVLGFITQYEFILKNQFLFSIILTGVAFLIVGAVKGKITGKHPFKSSIETLAIGGIAAILAFVVGYGLSMIV